MPSNKTIEDIKLKGNSKTNSMKGVLRISALFSLLSVLMLLVSMTASGTFSKYVLTRLDSFSVNLSDSQLVSPE